MKNEQLVEFAEGDTGWWCPVCESCEVFYVRDSCLEELHNCELEMQDELKEAKTSSNQALLQKVRDMLVDEDIIKVFLGQIDGYYDPKSPIRNELRAELRTKLDELEKEI